MAHNLIEVCNHDPSPYPGPMEPCGCSLLNGAQPQQSIFFKGGGVVLGTANCQWRVTYCLNIQSPSRSTTHNTHTTQHERASENLKNHPGECWDIHGHDYLSSRLMSSQPSLLDGSILLSLFPPPLCFPPLPHPHFS